MTCCDSALGRGAATCRILFHLIEETARHNGQIDILGEMPMDSPPGDSSAREVSLVGWLTSLGPI